MNAVIRREAPMSRREFVQLRDLIEHETGMHLPEIKTSLLAGRLSRRLHALGLTSFDAYYHRVSGGDREERVQMVDAICTHETHFFREPRHFEYLAAQHLPALVKEAERGRRPRRLRVWSAGCSSGEEPVSLAMVLMTHCPPAQGWSLEIVATDLSMTVLARARAGLWPVEKAREIPTPYLQAFMLRGVDDAHRGKMKACAELARLIRYEQLNLNDGDLRVAGDFDLIFCRNVLIYFTPEGRLRVVHRLLDRLRSDGLLFIGHAESLAALTSRVRCIEPTIYARR